MGGVRRGAVVAVALLGVLGGGCSSGGDGDAGAAADEPGPTTTAAPTTTTTVEMSTAGFRSWLETEWGGQARDVDWYYTELFPRQEGPTTTAVDDPERYLSISLRRDLDPDEVAAMCEVASEYLLLVDPDAWLEVVHRPRYVWRGPDGPCIEESAT